MSEERDDDMTVTCRQCDQLLPDLFEGRRDTTLLIELDEQVRRREGCQRCYGSYRKTADLCREVLAEATPPEGLPGRLTEFLRKTLRDNEES